MQKIKTPLSDAIEKCKTAFLIVFIFAFAVNLLTLLSSVYSLQVLDKVIGSSSYETLFWLSFVFGIIYIALSLLNVARSFTLIRIGEWLDSKLSPTLFSYSVSSAALRPGIGADQYLRDLNVVRTFLTSTGINSLFDAPWSVVYIAAAFYLHAYFGYLTLFSAAVMLIFAVINSYSTSSKLQEASQASMKSFGQAQIATRNAEVIEAMGMMPSIVKYWHQANDSALALQSVASYRNGIISNFTKFFRMIVQMMVTAIGAYLVMKYNPASGSLPELSVGGMIAASIIFGRALAPFDQAIEVWKHVISARESYKRLQDSFSRQIRPQAMSIPDPEGRLSVENVFYAPPQTSPNTAQRYTVRGVSFALEPGDILAIIGPSAAGKTTLAKLLVGVWKPMQGVVRLDGADVFSWNREDFGRHVGYLPQSVELFNGNIKENIARLRPDADPKDIVIAAQISGAHEMILNLPNGYETDIGIAGSALSAGQRQRIGLARAFFGGPKFVVLDEPNANLDEAGGVALVHALAKAKENKITTIIISHRPEILSSVDKILAVHDGAVAAFGPRNEILARFAAAAGQQPPASNIETQAGDK